MVTVPEHGRIIPVEIRLGILVFGVIATAVICGYIIVTFLRSKKGKEWYLEDKIFFGMCILTLIIGLSPATAIMSSRDLLDIGFTAFIIYIPDLMNLLFAMSCLVLLDYIVYRSKGRVKRNVHIAALPFTVMVLLEATLVYLARGVSEGKLSVNIWGRYFTNWVEVPYALLELIITTSFMIAAYRLVREYHIRRMEPAFLRFNPFIIPWIIGTLLELVLYISVMGVFDAIVLLLIYRVFQQREKYLDRETGAYNERFLRTYPDSIEQADLTAMTALVVTVHAQKEALLDILRDSIPDRTFVVRLDNGTFIIYSEVLSKMAIEMFERSMQDAGLNHNPPVSVKVRHFTRTAQETEADFTKRILEQGTK